MKLWGWATVALVVLFSVGTSACTYTFSYDSVSAPIGTVGDIGIHVQKTHNNCTLSSMDEYAIEGQGIQILGETGWEYLGSNVYEKWVQVSLSEMGDGTLKISKTCTKEGYEEKLLPITSLPAEQEDGLWAAAWAGAYPFDAPGDVASVLGAPVVQDGRLMVDGVAVTLPPSVTVPEVLPATVRLFTTVSSGETVAILLVGAGLFFRLDHVV
jgi:hypothetical protein